MIEQQLAEFMPQWEADQEHVDLSRRIAKLWEERYEQMQDDESLDGAVWYANHLNLVLNGSDPALILKLSEFQRKRTDAAIKKTEADIKAIEKWLAAVARTGHDEESKYREHLLEMQRLLAELKGEGALRKGGGALGLN
jgi:uncharacterized protein (DUF2235 family)